MKPHAIHYRKGDKWLTHYTPAKSIEAAEAAARIVGIIGVASEVVEVVNGQG